jgi:DNA gyrase subunit A
LAAGVEAVHFGAVPDSSGAVLVTVAGAVSALPGTEVGAVKVTRFSAYPVKGRATGGVRCHRLRSDADRLLLAWVGAGPPLATASSGGPIDLPPADDRRDGSGAAVEQPISAVAAPVSSQLPAGPG